MEIKFQFLLIYRYPKEKVKKNSPHGGLVNTILTQKDCSEKVFFCAKNTTNYIRLEKKVFWT